MNATHVHLVLNHFPIAGIIFAIPLLGFGWARNREDFSRAGLLLVVLSGIVSVPVFLSGEPSEHIVEKLAGVSKAAIERHEDAAKVAVWLVVAAAAASLGTLMAGLRGKNILRKTVPLTLLLCLGAAGMLAWTNNVGGRIRHPEIDTGAPTSAPAKTEGHNDD